MKELIFDSVSRSCSAVSFILSLLAFQGTRTSLPRRLEAERESGGIPTACHSQHVAESARYTVTAGSAEEHQRFFLRYCVNIDLINRGNLMGDAGVRVLTHILQMNRHLHTIFFDRNALSLNNFEEIVNAMEEYVCLRQTDFTILEWR